MYVHSSIHQACDEFEMGWRREEQTSSPNEHEREKMSEMPRSSCHLRRFWTGGHFTTTNTRICRREHIKKPKFPTFFLKPPESSGFLHWRSHSVVTLQTQPSIHDRVSRCQVGRTLERTCAKRNILLIRQAALVENVAGELFVRGMTCTKVLKNFFASSLHIQYIWLNYSYYLQYENLSY